MSEINLKLKTYDELTFEISRLNTDKYLLEQKLQQKENIIKEARKKIDNTIINCDGVADDLIDDIYEILEEKQDV